MLLFSVGLSPSLYNTNNVRPRFNYTPSQEPDKAWWQWRRTSKYVHLLLQLFNSHLYSELIGNRSQGPLRPTANSSLSSYVAKKDLKTDALNRFPTEVSPLTTGMTGLSYLCEPTITSVHALVLLLLRRHRANAPTKQHQPNKKRKIRKTR